MDKKLQIVLTAKDITGKAFMSLDAKLRKLTARLPKIGLAFGAALGNSD